jgi:demethylspheroidene O-methyltransferase
MIRGIAKRDGAALFDIVQGFVRAQVLYALVSLDVPGRLMAGPLGPAELAPALGLSPDRTEKLLQGGAGIGLLKRNRDGRFKLTRRGAALVGVPGLREMILHHDTFYRDLSDPVALLRGETETELARVWPYVLGEAAQAPSEVTELYSDLMTKTAALVAEDTLDCVSLVGITHLMDLGGGSGAFLAEVARRNPDLILTLFDLPGVMDVAERNLASQGLASRITRHPGSFRDDPLPKTVDAISLVRVLYDHNDDTVRSLLRKVRDALPSGGTLIVSEPMSGGAKPDPITDVYFAFYTLAMRTGRTRSAAEISALCQDAGFTPVGRVTQKRSFVTSVLKFTKT